MSRLAPMTALFAILMLPGVAAASEGIIEQAAIQSEVAPSEAAPSSGFADGGFLSDQELTFAVEAGLAADAAGDDLGPMAMTDADLDSQRGGFLTPLGLEIGFGAIVRTTIDGALALETRFSWTDNGLDKQVTTGDGALDLAAALAGGIDLGNGLSQLDGVVVPGADGGATAVLQNLNQLGVSNFVINTANDRVIRQDTEITLNVPQLDQMQKDMMSQAIQARLSDALSQALTLVGKN